MCLSEKWQMSAVVRQRTTEPVSFNIHQDQESGASFHDQERRGSLRRGGGERDTEGAGVEGGVERRQTERAAHWSPETLRTWNKTKQWGAEEQQQNPDDTQSEEVWEEKAAAWGWVDHEPTVTEVNWTQRFRSSGKILFTTRRTFFFLFFFYSQIWLETIKDGSAVEWAVVVHQRKISEFLTPSWILL